MVALLAAMFVAFGTSRAEHNDDKLGNVTHNVAQCNAGVLQGKATADATAYTEQVQVWVADTRTDTTTGTATPGFANLTSDLCKAEDTSTTPTTPAVNDGSYFSITPNGTEKPIITKLLPTATIKLGDSDGIVKAGNDLAVTISLKTIEPAATGTVSIEWVRVSGELDNPTTASDGTTALATTFALDGSKTPTGLSTTALIEIPEGTTERKYTVSARISYNHDGVDHAPDASPPVISPNKLLTPTAEFEVGDPGTNVASVELSYGNEHNEDPLTSAVDVIPEDGVVPAADGDVWLKVSAKNSRGEPSNSKGVNSIIAIARGGKLSIYPPTAAGTPNTAVTALDSDDNSASASLGDTVGATLFIKVERAGSPRTPGTVNVQVTLIGDDTPDSNVVSVTFTGPGATLTLGEAKAVAAGGQTEFSVTASDSDGNDASVGQLSIQVKDADGKDVPAEKLKAEPSTVGKSTATEADDKPNAVAVLITAGSGANAPASGEYTIEVSLVGVEDSKATATVVVTGAADDIALSTASDIAVGDLITVSAAVMDSNEAPVVNGTRVQFSIAAGDNLRGVTGHEPVVTETAAGVDSDGELVTKPVVSGGSLTKDGVATATYYVTGLGTTTIIATVPGTPASGKLDVTVAEAADGEASEGDDATDAEPSRVSISLSDDMVAVGESADVTIIATDANEDGDDWIAAVVVTVDGSIVDSEASGEQTIEVSCDEAGSVDVVARVYATDGSMDMASATVTCLGELDSLILGDPDGALSQVGEASATIEVTGAEDSAGNALDIPQEDYEVSIDGEGVDVSIDGTTVTVSVAGTEEDKVAAGDYTVTVTHGEVSATATVTVQAAYGSADSIELSASADEVSAGDLLTVTAMVTDSGGDPVEDGTEVTFHMGGALELTEISSTATEDGAATVTYIVGSGGGAATVYAVVGSASASLTVSTPDPVVEEAASEPSLGDFSRLSGLSSYSGPDTTASELLALLAGRATAIWLSSGDGWVLYAMADGAMVPGSEDFTATAGDVIYISN